MSNKDFYLEYINNFLTISGIAEWYGLEEDEAREFIRIGKEEFN